MPAPPSAHRLAPGSGALTGRSHRYEKRLSDLAGLYADGKAFDRLLGSGDRVVYAVEDVRPSAAAGDLCFGVTHMQPGRIGAEFFMTRGHIHAIANRPETYRGEAGRGVMLLESPDGAVETLEVAPETTIYVPPFWIHRSVNTGPDPLVMSFVYPADSGQDYGIIARSNGMKVRIVADGAGWRTVPNPAWRPRTAEDIAAIHATVA
ncbi:MAG: glucose-6-phosphate isomerase Pgi1 [Rhodobacteraceae bacterium HLUCCA08]|nr:MAG: glucose-6-phosphate isomerase Pgi1 [Rhodobacteraceae bacterium HLUCCA08]